MYSLIEHLPFEREQSSYPRMIMQLEQSKPTASPLSTVDECKDDLQREEQQL
jgi:hypothetical protein